MMMRKLRKIAAVGFCGLMLGGLMSVYMAPSAGARSYWCDNHVENWDRKASKDLQQGKITADEFETIQVQIAEHREQHGC